MKILEILHANVRYQVPPPTVPRRTLGSYVVQFSAPSWTSTMSVAHTTDTPLRNPVLSRLHTVSSAVLVSSNTLGRMW